MNRSVIEKTLYRFNSNGRDFEDLLEKGKYDYINSEIKLENFPDFSLPQKIIDLKIINMRELSNGSPLIGTEDILAGIESYNSKPAGIKELLSFGVEYPEVQKEKCIIALGSLISLKNDNKYAPCLWGNEDERGISVVWLKGAWDSSDNFAVI